MKFRLIASAAFIALFGGSAIAADLAVKAPPPPPAPIWSWTGWYVGLNVGGVWSNNDGVTHSAVAGPCNTLFLGCTAVPNYSTLLATGSTFNTGLGNNGGFTGGGQFGYNWQFGNGVAGFEADIAWTDQNRSITFSSLTPSPAFPAFPEAYTATASRHLDYLGTVRGRLGFLATPSFLLYGTGGLAYGEARSSTFEATFLQPFCGVPAAACAGGGGGSFSQVRAGWTVGAGGEWMFAPHWSLKAEYLYYDLGSVNYPTTLSQFCTGTCPVNGGLLASTTGATSLRYNGSIGRVGVNWHF
jgi:outer membrane immunogenic protein